MSPSKLEDLSQEILVMISKCVDDNSVRDLVNLAQVNSRFHHMAKGLLFEVIQFDYEISAGRIALDASSIARDVASCAAALKHNKVEGCVRYVVVTAYQKNVHGWHRRKLTSSWLNETKPKIEYRDISHAMSLLPGESTATVHGLDHAWKPLATLLSRLGGLRDVLFRSVLQVPPCLLDTLHQHHPRSRLHIEDFRLRSITEEKIDEHEANLVASPCLHSVSVHIKFSMDEDFITPQQIAFLWAIFNLAKGVEKVVFLVHDHTSFFEEQMSSQTLLDMDLLKGLANWNRACAEGTVEKQGSLRHLECTFQSSSVWTSWTPANDFWQKLASMTDFSILESLCLDLKDNCDVLTSLTSYGGLHNLRHVKLVMPREDLTGVYRPERRQPYNATLNFIADLPTLTDLELHSWPLSIRKSKTCLGAHLRRLDIMPSVGIVAGRACVKAIAKSCTSLEELSLTVRRFQGKPNEVACYRELGKIASLRRLSLCLGMWPGGTVHGDSGSSAGWEPRFDPSDCDVFTLYPTFQNRHLRDHLINAAVDTQLARDIFRVIASSNASEGSATFRYLVLNGVYSGPFQSLQLLRSGKESISICGDTMDVMESRPSPDDARAEHLFRFPVPRLHGNLRYRANHKAWNSRVLHVWKKLWPRNQGTSGTGRGGKTRLAWHSFPLDLSS